MRQPKDKLVTRKGKVNSNCLLAGCLLQRRWQQKDGNPLQTIKIFLKLVESAIVFCNG